MTVVPTVSMRAANITASLAAAAWFGIFLLGRDATYGIYAQGSGIHPTSGQIDNGVVLPLLVVVVLLAMAWLCTSLRRGARALATVSLLSIPLILPYLAGLGAGI